MHGAGNSFRGAAADSLSSSLTSSSTTSARSSSGQKRADLSAYSATSTSVTTTSTGGPQVSFVASATRTASPGREETTVRPPLYHSRRSQTNTGRRPITTSRFRNMFKPRSRAAATTTKVAMATVGVGVLRLHLTQLQRQRARRAQQRPSLWLLTASHHHPTARRTLQRSGASLTAMGSTVGAATRTRTSTAQLPRVSLSTTNSNSKRDSSMWEGWQQHQQCRGRAMCVAG